MTQQEYLQLVQQNPAFKNFPEDLKKSVLEATGARMERYIEVFIGAQKLLEQAQIEFTKKNEEIAKKLTQEIKVVQKQKLVVDEKRSAAKDEQEQNKLLEQINNL